jgi:pimeloyl-ACP methyl ester carboxylesterase
MPKVDLDDVSIHYEETGNGALAFVHCHGIGQSGKLFVEEFNFWGEYFNHVVTWDNRGLGESSSATKYSVPLYAYDLARLLNYLNIKKVILHGVSWGGIVVQQFALDYQDMCAAIIIDSSSSEVNVSASENWYKQSEESRVGKGIRKIKPEHMDSFLAQARATAGLREHPYTPRLKEISCPALIVGGGQDSIAGAGGSIILGRNLPNSRTEIFQDSEHGVYRHKQSEFRQLVIEFCKDHELIK